MNNKKTIDQAYPFEDNQIVTSNISELRQLSSKVEFKSETGLIVTLPNKDSGLLKNTTDDDLICYNVNDDIDLYLDSEGNVYKYNGKDKIYHDVIQKAKQGHIFNATIISIARQGLIVDVQGLQCFMPEGQIGIDVQDTWESYINKAIEVKLISIKIKEKESNRFLPIVSNKVIVDEKIALEAHDKLNKLKVGDVVSGTVKNIANYGVFVTLFPSVDGLIHITDLSWEKVSDPSTVVKVGQSISVVILDIKKNKDGKNRISLGYKQLSEKPWDRFDKNTEVGDVVSGTICNITDYGMFILLPSKVQGLIHKTELSWDLDVSLKDFQEGQTISAKVISIDWENEKLLLSHKQMFSNPWLNIEDKYHVGDVIEGTIRKITNFGLFVKIESNIEGLIHTSELSWIEHIKKPKEYADYTIGQPIKVIIISIDKEEQKIQLSIKRLTSNPWQKYCTDQFVRATIIAINKATIHTLIDGDNLPALIFIQDLPEEFSYREQDILECKIKEIDEQQRKIILALV